MQAPSPENRAGVLQQLQLLQAKGQHALAWLVDPDKGPANALAEAMHDAMPWADIILVGGSRVQLPSLDSYLDTLRQLRNAAGGRQPLVLFPGSPAQLSPQADAVLLLSLISGRNADWLIGKHVEAAPRLAAMQLEAIPTGYILVDGGKSTAVQYVSQTMPLPAQQPDLIRYTALAGQQLGLQCTYLEAGSGAQNPVAPATIRAVRSTIAHPLWVGGGLRSAAAVAAALAAGAQVAVLGNALEGPQRRQLSQDLTELKQKLRAGVWNYQ